MAERSGLMETFVRVRDGLGSDDDRGRRVMLWSRCTECGYLYSDPPSGHGAA